MLCKHFTQNNKGNLDKEKIRALAEERMKSKHLFAIKGEVRY